MSMAPVSSSYHLSTVFHNLTRIQLYFNSAFDSIIVMIDPYGIRIRKQSNKVFYIYKSYDEEEYFRFIQPNNVCIQFCICIQVKKAKILTTMETLKLKRIIYKEVTLYMNKSNYPSFFVVVVVGSHCPYNTKLSILDR